MWSSSIFRRRGGAGHSGNKVAELAERIVQRVMVGFCVLAVVADATGWLDRLAPGRASSSIILGVLTTIIIYLLLERRSAPAIEYIRKVVTAIYDMILQQRDYGGVIKTHDKFNNDLFNKSIR